MKYAAYLLMTPLVCMGIAYFIAIWFYEGDRLEEKDANVSLFCSALIVSFLWGLILLFHL